MSKKSSRAAAEQATQPSAIRGGGKQSGAEAGYISPRAIYESASTDHPKSAFCRLWMVGGSGLRLAPPRVSDVSAHPRNVAHPGTSTRETRCGALSGSC